MLKGTILYLGGFELPDKNAAAHRVLSNGKILKEIGYNVVFIDVDKSLEFNANIIETKKYNQGFECWSLPYPKSNGEWVKYLININSIKSISSRYDEIKAIIAYNYPAIALKRLKDYYHKHNIKVIGDCTEWYSTKGSSIVFKIVKGFDSFLRMRIIQKRLDGLIVISKYLENYYNECNNVIRIPPLVDIEEEKWNINSEENTRNDLIKFVYSGSPGKNKDKINLFVEALYKMKDYDNYLFKVVGVTREQYINDYPEHEELLSALEGKIEFFGRISHLESLIQLKNSDFSIFIRDNIRLTKAGFPTKFVESISCGIPVITTNTSDLEDYLIEGENGFYINTDSVKEITRIMKKILNYEKKEIFKIKHRRFVTDRFYYRDFIKKVDDFLQSVFL